ncbi:hypothetical protein A6R68_16897 [Neotoma lepida]|uniref:C3H1-type domain-containing protein n=1 Tax=Neotoma lepida TaxID=56216 RepID=A0A1A6HDL0_NEOLE|nr:hypothetical protein A6R68_16897 [Neotoma lepida]
MCCPAQDVQVLKPLALMKFPGGMGLPDGWEKPLDLRLPLQKRNYRAVPSLVLNRLRPSIPGGGKAPLGSPRWRNKGYRCIGGVLYKVSANKLSKTSSRPSDGSRAHLRTGRLEPATSCSRSLASRAVQRSLAIIRQAKQKKEKKREYCMYYNRFGRCNRGERCPYIHDPEKVAVCTRCPAQPH